MGQQTDNHVAAVNSELAKLKTALDTVKTNGDAFTATWQKMMKAYDTQGGQKASGAFGGTLKTEATNHDTALATAKAALANAQAAVKNMDTFVIQKDAATKNPFKKKSIGKAKNFVIAAKAGLAPDVSYLSSATGLMSAYDIGKKYYY